VTTGILKGELARKFGAGGFVGRASGRALSMSPHAAIAYDELQFDVPVLTEGDVMRGSGCASARSSRVSADRADSPSLPEGPVRIDVPEAGETREGYALVESFRGDVFVWLRIDCGGKKSPAATCAIHPGSSGRCWKSRSKATSSPTSLYATSRSDVRYRGTTDDI